MWLELRPYIFSQFIRVPTSASRHFSTDSTWRVAEAMRVS